MKKNEFLSVILFFGIIFSAIPAALFAQEKPDTIETPAVNEADNEENEKWGFVGFPVPFYSPETKIGIGAGFILFHKPDNEEFRPDELEFEGVGTQKKQVEAAMKGKTYFRGNDYLLSGKLKVRKWPDEFYGIGPDNPEKNREAYSLFSYSFTPSFQYQAVKNFYVGPLWSVANYNVKQRSKDGELIRNKIPGSDGTFASGAGAVFCWDAADSPFYPKKGFKSEVRMLSYRKEIGSEYNFHQIEIDHRHYFEVAKNHILAFQGLMTYSGGTVPWQMMPEMGGMMMLRGYYQGQNRDKDYAAAQTEYRFPIWWRIGGAVFAAAGEVAGGIDKFNFKYVHSSYGGGLRVLLDEKEHINLRLDVGITDTMKGNFYLSLLESF